MNIGPSSARGSHRPRAPRAIRGPSRAFEESADVWHRDTPLVAGASAGTLGGALVGVEGHERSVVEHRLAHDQEAVDRSAWTSTGATPAACLAVRRGWLTLTDAPRRRADRVLDEGGEPIPAFDPWLPTRGWGMPEAAQGGRRRDLVLHGRPAREWRNRSVHADGI